MTAIRVTGLISAAASTVTALTGGAGRPNEEEMSNRTDRRHRGMIAADDQPSTARKRRRQATPAVPGGAVQERRRAGGQASLGVPWQNRLEGVGQPELETRFAVPCVTFSAQPWLSACRQGTPSCDPRKKYAAGCWLDSVTGGETSKGEACLLLSLGKKAGEA